MLRHPGLVHRHVDFPCPPLTASADNIVYRGKGVLKSRVLLIFVPQPYALRSSRVLRTTYLLLSETPAVDHHAAQQ